MVKHFKDSFTEPLKLARSSGIGLLQGAIRALQQRFIRTLDGPEGRL